MTSATHAALLQAATARLSAAGIESARIDAEVLLAAALGVGRTELYCRLPEAVGAADRARFDSSLARRAAGEPTAYLTGEREFWSLPFTVTPEVLIPRPETELLVEIAVDVLRGRDPVRLCDVGTGSGCIAVALARELPHATLVATDIAPAALAVACRNAATHGVATRVTFTTADLFDQSNQLFDTIVSNPPYVAESDPLPREVAHEPVGALRAGPDGLDVIRRLIAAAPARLRPGGSLLIEIGRGQGDAVRQLAQASGFRTLSIRDDFAGIPRVLVAR